ncbi:MAG: hypothetical protein ACREIT_02915, partial [Tepidisphaeraceae bacterium]
MQRTQFYSMRQQVLEGRDVDQVIWGMIGDAIRDAVDKYITQDYVAATIAEWARVNFEVNLEVEDLRGMRTIADLEEFIKDKARAEAETNLTATLGEFTGEDLTDQTGWDVKGLSSWAMSRFHVNLPQSQIRKMDGHEVEARLREAAVEQIERRDCAGLMKYLEPMYAQTELSNWAKEKFGIEVGPQEMLADQRDREQKPKPADEIVELIEKRAREAYAQREVEYPVDHVLTFVTGGMEVGTIENPYAADYLRAWAKSKFGVDVAAEHIKTTPVRRLRDEMIGYAEESLQDGKTERRADEVFKASGGTDDGIVKAINDQFGLRLTRTDWLRFKESGSIVDAEGDGEVVSEDDRHAVGRFVRQY